MTKKKPTGPREYNPEPIVGKTIKAVTFPSEYSSGLTLHFTDGSNMNILIKMNRPDEAREMDDWPWLSWWVRGPRRKTPFPVFRTIPTGEAEPQVKKPKTR